jgi:hypothetical protein
MAVLTTAEHLHVMVNHVPLIGLAFAGVPLLFGLIARQRAALWAGLLMVLICGAAMPLVMETGEEAAIRLNLGNAAGTLDAAGKHWMSEHYERAELASKLIYGVLAAAIAGMVALWKRPQAAKAIGIAMLCLCVAGVATLGWVAAAGGRIRHPEFRPTEAPAVDTTAGQVRS